MKRHSLFFVFALLSMGLLPSFNLLGYAATLTVNAGGSIQAAIDSANAGDTIVVSAGTYTEDLNIGDINTAGNKKDNITLKAADGANVEIKTTNTKNRVNSLAALGADFGAVDRLGFFVYSDNAVIEGIKFTQTSDEVNGLKINCISMVISSNVTFRNCEFEGMGGDSAGDQVGLGVTPLDAILLSQGKGGVATHLTVENCTFHDIPYAFASVDFPLELGLPAPTPESTLQDCEFYNNNAGIEMDDGKVTATHCSFHDNNTGVHPSDDAVTLINCTIERSLEHGIDVDAQENEADEPQGNPVINIENCVISESGSTNDHNGIHIEQGTVTVKNTIIRGSSGPNVGFDNHAGRLAQATFDHCDIYNSLIGSAISLTASDPDIIQLSVTNSILVDFDGIVNNSGPQINVTLDSCDLFVTDALYYPDQTNIKATNVISKDPLYKDAENGDFILQADSPVAAAGLNGTYLGSQGTKTSIDGWMLQ